MKVLNIDGVDCFVFLEAMKPTKGMVVNVIAPVDNAITGVDRKYVTYRNGFIPFSSLAREPTRQEQREAREAALTYYENLTADDVRQFLTSARAQALEQV